MVFKKIIGIDLGTVKSRVVLPERGIIFEQPTIVAYDKQAKKIIAVGEDALELIGKTPEGIEIIRPIKNSVLSNYRATESLLRFMISEAVGRFSLVKPFLVLSVPSVITSVEKRALEEAALNAGAGEVFLYPASFLASLGAGLEIDKPFGNMIVNIGGGTTETAVLSYNGIVVSNSGKQASAAINESIINFFKKIYGLIIGEMMAERIKVLICSAVPVDNQKELEVRGRDATTGMPKAVMVKTNDLVEAVKPVLSQIIISIRSVLEKTPPELSSDIVDTGIMLSGAGVMLDNITTLFVKALSIPVVIAEDPEHATAFGIQKIIENFDTYAYKGKVK